MKKILFFLIFSYTFLNAQCVKYYYPEYNTYLGLINVTSRIFTTSSYQISSPVVGIYYYDDSDKVTLINKIVNGRSFFTIYYTDNTVCTSVTPVTPTCTDKQYLDSNNTCQNIVRPTTMPQDGNASHGAYSTGYATLAKAGCNSSNAPDFSTSLGTFHIVGWDYAVNKCIGIGFKCNANFIYKKNSKTCVAPSDYKVIPPNNDPTDSANSCGGNKWGRTWTYDFCGKCDTSGSSVTFWLPPIGLDGYGLKCNNRYVEYDCRSDYRLKKFTQVSCGNTLLKDKTTKNLNANGLKTTPTKDKNASNLAPGNSTISLTAKISKQIELQKVLNTKVSTSDNQNKILNSLNKLGTKLDKINNSGKLSQNGVENGVKKALESRDNNLSVPSDINKTGTPGGNGIGAVKNSILNQYSKRYDLFGVSTCGSLSVASNTISFMQTTIENPLVVMDNSLKPYYDLFKSFFLIVATFLGLVSVFRR